MLAFVGYFGFDNGATERIEVEIEPVEEELTFVTAAKAAAEKGNIPEHGVSKCQIVKADYDTDKLPFWKGEKPIG